MQYSEIKTLAQAMYGNYIGKGFIEDTSGSPTELALYLFMVCSMIAAEDREYSFTKITGTLTLDGSTSYNLKSNFSDYMQVYQVYGINDNLEHDVYPDYSGNITPADGYHVKDGVLYFTGNAPSSGTATVQYKSQYLVEDSSGTRKQYFENSDDVSVLPNVDTPVLLFGLGQFVQWKTDTKSKAKREQVDLWFARAFENLDRNEMSRQLNSMI